MIRRPLVLSLVLAAVGLIGTACSGPPPFDRDAAVRDVVARGNGRISQPQAECYVDRVRDELGTAPLAANAQPTPEQVPKLTNIRIDCIGVTSIGTVPPATIPLDLSALGSLPSRRGDDPALDVLYDACANGDGAACDRLFDAAPIGSDYENYAGTCGGRQAQLRCADQYPGPSTTTVTEPVPSTTTTPAP